MEKIRLAIVALLSVQIVSMADALHQNNVNVIVVMVDQLVI